MQKKKHQSKIKYIKPPTSAHPSLGRVAGTNQNIGKPPLASVNGLIDHLRRTQVSSSTASTSTPEIGPPIATLNVISQLLATQPYSTPSSAIQLSPRAQMAARRAARGPAGPPPPRSWLLPSMNFRAGQSTLKDSRYALASASIVSTSDSAIDGAGLPIITLPDIQVPEINSMQGLIIRKMVLNWSWHAENDGQWIGNMLPGWLRGYLLLELAKANVKIGRRELENVLWEVKDWEESEQGTRESGDKTEVEEEWDGWEQQEYTSGGLTHLVIGPSLGSRLSYKDLGELILGQPAYLSKIATNGSPETTTNSNPMPIKIDPSSPPTTFIPHRTFQTLTHLSLSHTTSPSWRALLSPSLSGALGLLTHLDLSYWPFPTLTPHAARTGATTLTPAGPVNYSGTGFYTGTKTYSPREGEWEEAATLLRRLGRITRKLVWLGLEGCGPWAQAWSCGLNLPARGATENTRVEEGQTSIASGGGDWAQWEEPMQRYAAATERNRDEQDEAVDGAKLSTQTHSFSSRGTVDWLGAWRGLRTMRLTTPSTSLPSELLGPRPNWDHLLPIPSISDVFPWYSYAQREALRDYLADHAEALKLERAVRRLRGQAGLPGIIVERGGEGVGMAREGWVDELADFVIFRA